MEQKVPEGTFFMSFYGYIHETFHIKFIVPPLRNSLECVMINRSIYENK